MADRVSGAPAVALADARRALAGGTGRGIRVAVIDSGVEAAHPELGGLRLRDDVVVRQTGARLEVVDGAGEDVFGHGTAVAGVLRRVAPEVEIGSFRVLDARLGSRTPAIREGVRQAIDRGYHVLNCSFGCRGDAQLVMPYKEWLDEAYVKGRHVVAACNNFDFSIPEWPAYFPSVVAVNMGRLQGLEFCHVPGQLVEFVAPGDRVEVPWAGGARKRVTGSSYAAPVMAGLLARLLSVHPWLSPLEAKALLHRLASPFRPEVAADNVTARHLSALGAGRAPGAA